MRPHRSDGRRFGPHGAALFIETGGYRPDEGGTLSPPGSEMEDGGVFGSASA